MSTTESIDLPFLTEPEEMIGDFTEVEEFKESREEVVVDLLLNFFSSPTNTTAFPLFLLFSTVVVVLDTLLPPSVFPLTTEFLFIIVVELGIGFEVEVRLPVPVIAEVEETASVLSEGNLRKVLTGDGILVIGGRFEVEFCC